MKPSELCKKAGLKSLAELAELTGESPQTLNNWHKTRPRRFMLLLLGATVFKSTNEVIKHD